MYGFSSNIDVCATTLLVEYIYYNIQVSLPDPPQGFISSETQTKKQKRKLNESVSQKAPEFGIKLLFDLLVCKANCIKHA